MLRIGVIGEQNPANETHVATDAALVHSAAALGVPAMARWVGTEEAAGGAECLEGMDCLLIAPGSPYRNREGALLAISYARQHDVPVLGTCGGFQHMVLEVAQNVLGYTDAEHAETNPEAQRLLIVPTTCSLRGQQLPVNFSPGSQAATAYGALSANERYYCSFELNATYTNDLAGAGLAVTGTGPDGEARVVELEGHPFFMGTLFVPQVASTLQNPHPLVTALLRSAFIPTR